MNPILTNLSIPTPQFQLIQDDHFEEAFKTVCAEHRTKRDAFLSEIPAQISTFIQTYEAMFQDINAFGRAEDLQKFNIYMLYDDSDQLFANWMIERLENFGFSVFDPNRDMRIGMIEHANNTDIISRRCEQVIL